MALSQSEKHDLSVLKTDIKWILMTMLSERYDRYEIDQRQTWKMEKYPVVKDECWIPKHKCCIVNDNQNQHKSVQF